MDDFYKIVDNYSSLLLLSSVKYLGYGLYSYYYIL
jgi:hypothetical protein